jgi:hypothetical protein
LFCYQYEKKHAQLFGHHLRAMMLEQQANNDLIGSWRIIITH